MELALSLGNRGVIKSSSGVNFCMGLTPSSSRSTVDINLSGDHDHHHKMMITNGGDDDVGDDDDDESKKMEKIGSSSSCDRTANISPRQLDLLPLSPVPRTLTTLPSPPLRFPWLSENLSSEPGSSDGPGQRTMEVDRRQTTTTVVGATAEDGDAQSSPNSGTSSFMEFSLYTNSNNNCKRSNGNVEGVIVGGGGGGEQVERGGTTSRGSDEEENGCSTRKKLRLSKEQSAFLEESFKEHHTLNPKQKQALAKELNLRPRQVEVWFQNRRARTKLKQTEVDCEYLKRCCETLTEENRRLQKELHDLRALKTSQPFFMQLPATTLTMCPSCERVAPTSSSAAAHKPVSSSVGPSAAISSGNDDDDDHDDNGTTLSLGKPSSNNNNNNNNNNNSNVPFSSNTPTKTC